MLVLSVRVAVCLFDRLMECLFAGLSVSWREYVFVCCCCCLCVLVVCLFARLFVLLHGLFVCALACLFGVMCVVVACLCCCCSVCVWCCMRLPLLLRVFVVCV